MKEKQISYADLAFNAMCRAATEAHKKAAAHNLKIPIWKNGKVHYVDPNQLPSEKCPK